MSDLKDCPLCGNNDEKNDPENFWDTIVLGQNGGANLPHATVSCNRCGLQVIVFWQRGPNGKPVKGPLPKELMRPALDEAKRRWNHLPRAPEPYPLAGGESRDRPEEVAADRPGGQ